MRIIMEKCEQVANLYIAMLRTIALVHHFNHWTAKGSNFYGDHLLFQRIYESALEDLDGAGEKFMGVLENCLDYDLQTTLIAKLLNKYKPNNDIVDQSLSIEKDFLKLNKEARACFEKAGKLSLGLDDMLAAISSSREEAVYLLQQLKD